MCILSNVDKISKKKFFFLCINVECDTFLRDYEIYDFLKKHTVINSERDPVIQLDFPQRFGLVTPAIAKSPA